MAVPKNMTPDSDGGPNRSRRRFLAGVGLLLAAGGGAVVGWLRQPSRSSSETVAGRTATAPALRSSVVDRATTPSTVNDSDVDKPGPTTTAQPTESESESEAKPETTETEAETETTETETTEAETETETTESETTESETVNKIAIPVICRQAWGAAKPSAAMTTHAIKRLTVHHTASPISRVADAPAKIRTHQRFHQQDRGWPDLAYHFLIDPAGNVYQGRDPSFRGDTATSYDPTGHFLVCLEGDYEQAAVNDAQIASLARVLAWGSFNYGVAVSTLAGHRDYAGTQCPGDAVYALLTDGSLAASVEGVLRAGRPELQDVCGADGQHLVDEIKASSVEL